MNEKEIIFIRHAESWANAGFSTVSAQSIALSPKGSTQAENLANNFPITPELIVVSKFLRTQETAKPFISKNPHINVEVWDMIHEFTYLDRKQQNNKTPEQRKPFAQAYWRRNDPFYLDGPEEETFFDLLKRTELLMETLKNRKEKSIAVFSHGQFLIALKLVKNLNAKIDSLTPKKLSGLMTRFLKLQEIAPIQNAAILRWEDL